MQPSIANARTTLRHIAGSVYTDDFDRVSAADATLDDHHATLDRRARLFTALGSWALILTLALVSMCCAGSQRVARTVPAQWTSAVQIHAECIDPFTGRSDLYMRGSGVVVSSTQILTAWHVVSTTPPICRLRASTTEGDTYALTVDMAAPEADVVRMTIDGTFKNASTPKLGPKPAVGTTVCVLGAIPSRQRRCGEAQWTFDVPPPGDIEHTAITEPGNSGGGLYDSRGRLVGIVTHLQFCRNGQICGGRATSLAGPRSWLIP